jgi:tetratricopeptide (TPR) repeat protein
MHRLVSRHIVTIALASLVGSAGRAQTATPATEITIPDSLFEPVTLPPELSFGYPPNTIYLPQILDLTRRRSFDTLETMFSGLEADVARNVKNEVRFSDAFQAFNRDEPPLLEHLDAWVAARPRSAHARVARATYHFGTAWRRRGKAYIRDTPPEKIKAMEEFSKKAIDDLTAAMQRDSTHLVAYETLIEVAQLFGAHDVAAQALARGLSMHRGSFNLYHAFVLMLWPRWGGSEQVMADFGERAARDSADNPRLVALRGAVYQSRAYDSTLAGDHAGAVRELNRALGFGPERTYIRDRGEAYFRLGAWVYAFNDLRSAMIERSQDSEVLSYYGRTLVEIAARVRPEIRPKVLDRALETLALATYLAPSDTAAKAALDRARRMAGK